MGDSSSTPPLAQVEVFNPYVENISALKDEMRWLRSCGYQVSQSGVQRKGSWVRKGQFPLVDQSVV